MSTTEVQSALLKIILLCLCGILALAVLSFWIAPAYFGGVSIAQETCKEILIGSLCAKAGIAQPGDKP